MMKTAAPLLLYVFLIGSLAVFSGCAHSSHSNKSSEPASISQTTSTLSEPQSISGSTQSAASNARSPSPSQPLPPAQPPTKPEQAPLAEPIISTFAVKAQAKKLSFSHRFKEPLIAFSIALAIIILTLFFERRKERAI